MASVTTASSTDRLQLCSRQFQGTAWNSQGTARPLTSYLAAAPGMEDLLQQTVLAASWPHDSADAAGRV